MTDLTLDTDLGERDPLELPDLQREPFEVYVPELLPLGSGAAWGEAAGNHHGDFVYPGRRVLLLPGRAWPATPEVCQDFNRTGEWVLQESVLICRGCGLDVT